MQIQLKIDENKAIQDIQEKLDLHLKTAVHNELMVLFKSMRDYNSKTGQFETVKGPAVLVIEELIAKKLSDEKLKAKIDSYIDENIEKFLNEAMAKATQHIANKAVFTSKKVSS